MRKIPYLSKKKLTEAFKQYKTIVEVSKKLKVSYPTVKKFVLVYELGEVVEKYKKSISREGLLEAIEQERGNLTHTAKRLKRSYQYLRQLIIKYNLQEELNKLRDVNKRGYLKREGEFNIYDKEGNLKASLNYKNGYKEGEQRR